MSEYKGPSTDIDSRATNCPSDSELSSDAISETKEDCHLTDYLNEKPPDLYIPDEAPASLKFHPKENLLFVGCCSGSIFMVSYEVERSEVIHKLPGHERSSRALIFSDDGERLFSVSADRSINVTDVERCYIIKSWKEAHIESLTAVTLVDDNIFATGDEKGGVKLWDYRKTKDIFSAKKSTDFISSLLIGPDNKLLLSTSADGFLTAFDLRMQKFLYQRNRNKELIDSMHIRDSSRLLVATASTSFHFYAWENLPESCGAFVVNMKKWKYMPSVSKINESFMACGSDSGFIRAVRVFPHENIGIIGHLDNNGSCDLLATSHDSVFVAGSDYHGPVRFWNVSYFQQEDYTSYQRSKLFREEKHLPSSSYSNPGDFFAGLQ